MERGFHVLGAGSIGCLFAHHLARAGLPVTLLLRAASLAAFDAAGRAVRCGGVAAACRAEAVGHGAAAAAAAGQGPQPAVRISNLLVTTKASQTAGAVAAVSHRLGASSVVVLLQNGVLGVYEELIGSQFPDPARRPQFLLGSTTHGAWRRAPFDVVWHEGAAVFGRPLGSCGAGGGAPGAAGAGGGGAAAGGADRAGEVLRLLASPELAALRIDASLTPQQLHQQLLLKLLVNACVNPLAALLHCRNGGLLGNAPARGLMAALVAECRAALGESNSGGNTDAGSSGSSSGGGSNDGGGGSGLRGSEEELLARVEGVVGATSGNLNSMLQDVVKGAPTEIGYLNGYVVRQAEARGLVAPLNAALVQLVRAREAVPSELRTHEELR